MEYFTKKTLSKAEEADLRSVARRPWRARFHKTLDNETAPGGKVDMFTIIDDGEQLVSVAVPHGQGYIADWIAGCCANPWFVEPDDGEGTTKLAQALNRAIVPHLDPDGTIDARDVTSAAMVVISSYAAALPSHARAEVTDLVRVGLRMIEEDSRS